MVRIWRRPFLFRRPALPPQFLHLPTIFTTFVSFKVKITHFLTYTLTQYLIEVGMRRILVFGRWLHVNIRLTIRFPFSISKLANLA